MKFAIRAIATVFVALGIITATAMPSFAVLNPIQPWRFGTTNPCLNDPIPSKFPTGTAAFEWSKSADLNITHQYGINECDGWSEATTIDVYYADFTGPDDAICMIPIVDYTVSTGIIANTALWINIGSGANHCFDTAVERGYWTVNSVGYILGLASHHNGNRSVMSDTYWSEHNISVPQPSDFEAIERRYPW